MMVARGSISGVRKTGSDQVLSTNTFGMAEHPIPSCGRPVCYDTSFSKFCSALLKGIDTRNIPRHLVMILPNIGSLRL
jgi:hypothetical protein